MLELKVDRKIQVAAKIIEYLDGVNP
jgi:hypothetical protein